MVAEMGRNGAALLRRAQRGLAGRGIGNFTKDGGAEGSGGGGMIARTVVESLVGEECEGVGFLGVFGNAELGGRKNLDGI